MSVQVDITQTLWLEITPETFSVVKDHADESPLSYIDLDKDQARLVHDQLGKFLMGCHGSVEEDDLEVEPDDGFCSGCGETGACYCTD